MSAPIASTPEGAGVPGSSSSGTFFGHPRGLSTLFFTEMWERFSYYGMKAFLILFLIAEVRDGGRGLSEANGGIVVGVYTSLVYLMSLPGGWLADKYLGLRRAVFVGGILIMSGHIVLALPFTEGLYLGLGLVVLGTGLLKPNISALVGQLYSATDVRRDAGYSIYYMGINIGALIAPIACGTLAQSADFRAFLAGHGIDPNIVWHVAFSAAAFGMGFGLVQYWLGLRHLDHVGAPPVRPTDPALVARDNKILAAVIFAVFGLPGIIIGLHYAGTLTLTEEKIGNWFGIILIVIAVSVFTWLFSLGARTTEERRRVGAMLVLFVGCIAFFGLFEQAATTLNLFADKYNRNSVLGIEFPSTWFQSINSFWVIVLAPVFAFLWVRLGRAKIEPSSVAKFATAMVFLAVAFAVMLPTTGPIAAGEKVSPGFLIALYLFFTCGEMCLSPVGLSSMSKLAPQRLAGMVMGVWFLGSGIGNYLAGRATQLTATMSVGGFFLLEACLALGVAALLFLAVGPVKRMLARNDA